MPRRGPRQLRGLRSRSDVQTGAQSWGKLQAELHAQQRQRRYEERIDEQRGWYQELGRRDERG